MEGERIGEVRGIVSSQNLDSKIAGSGLLEDKLKEFGKEGELYFKRVEHMKRLTAIEDKADNGGKLTKEELRFCTKWMKRFKVLVSKETLE